MWTWCYRNWWPIISAVLCVLTPRKMGGCAEVCSVSRTIKAYKKSLFKVQFSGIYLFSSQLSWAYVVEKGGWWLCRDRIETGSGVHLCWKREDWCLLKFLPNQHSWRHGTLHLPWPLLTLSQLLYVSWKSLLCLDTQFSLCSIVLESPGSPLCSAVRHANSTGVSIAAGHTVSSCT